MVGPVRHVDSDVRPYPQFLLPRTVSTQSLAGPQPRQSGKVTHAWWSPVGTLIQDHGMDLRPSHPLGRGHGSRLLQTGWLVGTMGLGGLEEVMAQEGGRLTHAQS
jgi:hypothetical protein